MTKRSTKLLRGESDMITNPNTGRLVKIGGKVWQKLVLEGSLPESDDKNILGDLGGNDNECVADKIELINNTLPLNQQAVRGRGFYSNKIVRRTIHKPPAHVEQPVETSDDENLIYNEVDQFEADDECDDDEEYNKMVNMLIASELLVNRAGECDEGDEGN